MYLSKTTIIFIAALFAALLLLYTCNRCNPPLASQGPTVISRTTKKDSSLLPKDSGQTNHPHPVAISVFAGGKIPDKQESSGKSPSWKMQVHQDTLPYEWIGVNADDYIKHLDTTAIVDDFFAKRTYHETYRLNGGVVTVDNSVSENQLDIQKVTLDSVERVSTTNTVTVREAPRTQFYFSLGGQYNMGDRSMAVGAGGMLMTKKGPTFEGLYLLDTKGHAIIQGTAKFLISFRRR